MSWAKFDDRYHDNRKVKRAWRGHPRAVGLHAMAVTYCAMHETDGLVDAEWIEEKLPAKAERDKVLAVLVDVGLFIAEGGGDYSIHDYLMFNPSKEDAEAQRRKNAERQSRWRDKHRNGGDTTDRNGVTNADVTRESQRPVPTRPDPSRIQVDKPLRHLSLESSAVDQRREAAQR